MLIVVQLRKVDMKNKGREEDRQTYNTFALDLLWLLLYVRDHSRNICCSIVDLCVQ